MLLKTAFREIKTSLGRYLAILAIIALGVGFFAGLRVTRTAMISTANHYLKDLAMFDDRILSTLGLTEEDVDAFRKLDGVSAAEGARSADLLSRVFGGSLSGLVSTLMDSGQVSDEELDRLEALLQKRREGERHE